MAPLRCCRPRGLRFRLIALLLLAVLPVFGLVCYTAREMRARQAREAVERSMRMARNVVATQQHLVDSARQLLTTITYLPQLHQAPSPQADALLARLLEQYPVYANIGVTDASGRVIASAVPLKQPVEISDRAYFIRARESGQFALGDYQIGRITKIATVNFGYPILAPDGAFSGVVYVALDLSWLQQVVARAELPPGSTLMVVDSQGVLLACVPHGEAWIGRNVADQPFMRATLADGMAMQPLKGLDGVERLYARCPLAAADGKGRAHVVVGIPTAVVFAETNRLLRNNVIMLLVVTAATLAATWLVAGVWILRPVRALIEATRRMARGDLEVRRGAYDEQSELGELARAFDEMARALQQRQAELLESQREREQMRDQLRQAQKMEAIGQLAGGVAHDFNNLLQAIIGFTHMAMAALSERDQAYHDLAEVLKAAERASSLTRQLLAFSRKQVLQPAILDLNDVINGVLSILQRLIGADISLTFLPAAELPPIRADRSQMEQVIINLCLNARDAMPTGGRIVIETDQADIDQDHCSLNPWAKPGRYVVLTVTDTGSGIAPEVQERIFEPFFTTKNEGTGLGLAMVYGVVQQHEGFIYVYSEPGCGAAFKVYLPVAASDAVGSPQADVTAARGGDETLLVAEDNETLLALLARALHGAGYTVIKARDGEEAVALFERHAEEIKLAVLDVIMPRLNGRAVYERIAALNPDLPVVFSSGYSANVLNDPVLAQRRVPLLQKPYDPKRLLTVVRELLDEAARRAAAGDVERATPA